MPVISRIRTAVNAFLNNDRLVVDDYAVGAPTYSASSPSVPRRRYTNERTIVSSLYTKMAIDVADAVLRHVKLDEMGRYEDDMKSRLQACLMLEPNIDQGPRAFRQDIALTLFDKGVAAIVPVDTTVDPEQEEVFDIITMRVGEVVKWYPKHIRVSLYNEKKGLREEIVVQKRSVAIVENPLYLVMNEPNSTLQRLVRKLNLLDAVDEQSSSGKLDIIIQLPYTIKSEALRNRAEARRTEIEMQLRDSQYGIAYADGTEKITQLNRPAENNLLKQVEFLTEMLYDQLGITKEVMSGTADEKTMLNYLNRTVKPIVQAIVEAMQRAFLGPVGTDQDQRIYYFNDPFKLVPLSELADIVDKFSRNEILSPNEIRGFMGVPPSTDPKADKLQNSNMPPADTEPVA